MPSTMRKHPKLDGYLDRLEEGESFVDSRLEVEAGKDCVRRGANLWGLGHSCHNYRKDYDSSAAFSIIDEVLGINSNHFTGC